MPGTERVIAFSQLAVKGLKISTHNKIARVVVHMDLSISNAKQNLLPVRRPLKQYTTKANYALKV
jgi:hypothetical protein